MEQSSGREIDVNKIVGHWLETSDYDFQTMLSLYASKSFSWSLFMAHLVLEKLLKAIYVRKYRQHAPFIHNLYRLAELSGLPITDEYADWLDTISTFNINARYDDYKKQFYHKCTPDYTLEWLEKVKILRLWIKEMQ